jgi:cellulose synthase/poly-beta-1,6-N-acetylglucosamine synthase-like glycosyltransferase
MMKLSLHLLLIVNSSLLSLFVGYHLFFLILYPFVRLKKKPRTASDTKYNKFAIIIPAHNEEMLIRDVLQSTKNLLYPTDKYQVIVVADNCDDRTAKIVRDMSIECFERYDSEKKGKPYALEWIFQQIPAHTYDAFVIVDGDTLVDKHFLNAMNKKLNEGAEVIQGYFGIMNPEDTWLTRSAVIPGILKFKIRYFCKDFIGLSCPLMGNGMCFSKMIIENYGWNAFSITENWEYYTNLVLNNHMTSYEEDALIYSHAAISLKQAETQRKRWLKGRLQTVMDYVPQLIVSGVKERSIVRMDAAMELILPSYSMLFNWSILSLLLVVSLWILGMRSSFIFSWLLALAAIQLFLFLGTLIVSEAPLRTWISFCYMPIYLAWKLVLTVGGICTFRDRRWRKTNRHIK